MTAEPGDQAVDGVLSALEPPSRGRTSTTRGPHPRSPSPSTPRAWPSCAPPPASSGSSPTTGTSSARPAGRPRRTSPPSGSAWLHRAGRTVAVVDTGVQRTHPYLAGLQGRRRGVLPTRARREEVSICPGGAEQLRRPRRPAAPLPADDRRLQHGTHVAGIVAGGPVTLQSGQRGVAPDVSIIAVKVFTEGTDRVRRARRTPPRASTPTTPTSTRPSSGSTTRSRPVPPGSPSSSSVNLSLGGGGDRALRPGGRATKQLVDTLAVTAWPPWRPPGTAARPG